MKHFFKKQRNQSLELVDDTYRQVNIEKSLAQNILVYYTAWYFLDDVKINEDNSKTINFIYYDYKWREDTVKYESDSEFVFIDNYSDFIEKLNSKEQAVKLSKENYDLIKDVFDTSRDFEEFRDSMGSLLMNGEITQEEMDYACYENDPEELFKKETLNIRLIGIDDWDRPVYKDELGRLYKDISLGKEPLDNSLCTAYQNNFYGEPDIPIKSCIVNIKEEGKSFIDDKEKMRDFKKLTREEFLKSYSYLKEEDYQATLQELNKKRKHER